MSYSLRFWSSGAGLGLNRYRSSLVTALEKSRQTDEPAIIITAPSFIIYTSKVGGFGAAGVAPSILLTWGRRERDRDPTFVESHAQTPLLTIGGPRTPHTRPQAHADDTHAHYIIICCSAALERNTDMPLWRQRGTRVATVAPNEVLSFSTRQQADRGGEPVAWTSLPVQAFLATTDRYGERHDPKQVERPFCGRKSVKEASNQPCYANCRSRSTHASLASLVTEMHTFASLQSST
jgi:hypothetical protein